MGGVGCGTRGGGSIVVPGWAVGDVYVYVCVCADLRYSFMIGVCMRGIKEQKEAPLPQKRSWICAEVQGRMPMKYRGFMRHRGHSTASAQQLRSTKQYKRAPRQGTSAC